MKTGESERKPVDISILANKVSLLKENLNIKGAISSLKRLGATLKSSFSSKKIKASNHRRSSYIEKLKGSINEVVRQVRSVSEERLSGRPPLFKRIVIFIKKIFNNRSKESNSSNTSEYEFKDKGITYGKEKAPVEKFLAEIESKIDELNPEKDTDRINYFNELKEKGWIASNEFRNQVKENGFDEACERWVSEPVNMRYHELEMTGEKEMGFARLGVITDPRNGFTNLKELKELEKDEDLRSKKIEDLKLIDQSKLNKNQKKSVSRAIAQLENISTTIEEREANLNNQFLKLLQLQVDKNKPEGASFSLVHLSLLNPKRDKLEKSGWMHNEANSMNDMSYIFTSANGKKIHFDSADGKPSIDKDGNFHLSEDLGEGSITLRAALFNASTQGYTENEEIQAEVNLEGLKNLGLQEDSELGKLLLTPKKFNYEKAEVIAANLYSRGALSLCCASGKDRTGVVAARLVQNQLQKYSHIPNAALKKFEKSILRHKRLASQVVYENTGARTLKVHPVNINELPGITPAEKANLLFNQVKEMLK